MKKNKKKQKHDGFELFIGLFFFSCSIFIKICDWLGINKNIAIWASLVFSFVMVVADYSHKTNNSLNVVSKRKKGPAYNIQKEIYQIDRMSGRQFEFWCAQLLFRVGFTDVRVTPASNDQGADIIAYNGGYRCAIQCKCYSSSLGNKPIQEVYAAKSYYGCSIAYVMTNSSFTKGAQDAADATGVLLIDRTGLVSYMNEANRQAWLLSKAYKKSVRKEKRQKRKLAKQTVKQQESTFDFDTLEQDGHL